MACRLANAVSQKILSSLGRADLSSVAVSASTAGQSIDDSVGGTQSAHSSFLVASPQFPSTPNDLRSPDSKRFRDGSLADDGSVDSLADRLVNGQLTLLCGKTLFACGR